MKTITTPILAIFPVKDPARRAFSVIDPNTDQVLISGFCAADAIPTFPEECLYDALTNPYLTIKQTFIPLPTTQASAVY